MPPTHSHGASRWPLLRFCAALGLVGLSIPGLSIPSAQAQMDWGGMIGTYGQEEAVKEAAHEGSAR